MNNSFVNKARNLMKVLENNYNKNKTIIVNCYNCDSKIELEESELVTGCGDRYFKCPCCGVVNIFVNGAFCSAENSNDEKILTAHNFKFPEDFNEFNSKNKDTVSIKNAEIEKWIKQCCEYLDAFPEEPFRCIASGDTTVVVFNLEDDDGEKCKKIIVAKGYYEAEFS